MNEFEKAFPNNPEGVALLAKMSRDIDELRGENANIKGEVAELKSTLAKIAMRDVYSGFRKHIIEVFANNVKERINEDGRIAGYKKIQQYDKLLTAIAEDVKAKYDLLQLQNEFTSVCNSYMDICLRMALFPIIIDYYPLEDLEFDQEFILEKV